MAVNHISCVIVLTNDRRAHVAFAKSGLAAGGVECCALKRVVLHLIGSKREFGVRGNERVEPA